MDGDIASQPKLHLQQTFPLFYPQSYKHPKTTKLNLNTPWMKKNYIKKSKLINFFSYLP
jgi:hypothetical protein